MINAGSLVIASTKVLAEAQPCASNEILQFQPIEIQTLYLLSCKLNFDWQFS